MESIITTKRREEDLTSCTAGSGAVINSSIIRTDITHNPSLLYHASKRLLDIVLAAIGMVVLIPIFLVIAICIKLEGGGDILYFREIVGLYHRRFLALKFRTMI